MSGAESTNGRRVGVNTLFEVDPVLLADAKTQRGQSLGELSSQGRVMVIFLRHAGCTFCREALDDIAQLRDRLEEVVRAIVFVHLIPIDKSEDFFEQHGVGDIHRIYDPEKKLYKAFDLKRGSVAQLFGMKNWHRGIEAGIRNGHGIGWIAGDPLQMPGAFLIEGNNVTRAFRHEYAGERPDYEGLVRSLSAHGLVDE